MPILLPGHIRLRCVRGMLGCHMQTRRMHAMQPLLGLWHSQEVNRNLHTCVATFSAVFSTCIRSLKFACFVGMIGAQGARMWPAAHMRYSLSCPNVYRPMHIHEARTSLQTAIKK